MILNATTLPNPTEIEITAGRLITANLAYSGFRTQVFTRYYASANPNPGQPVSSSVAIRRLKLTWANLGATEIAALRTAFDAANTGYVLMTCPGLGMTYNNVADSAMVTVDPEVDNLTIDYMQGYTGAGEGPVVYDAQAAFIVQTFFESAP